MQTDFQRYLFDQSNEIHSLIKEDARADADARLAVYYSGYRARLIEVLRINYPQLAKLLGDDAFSRLATNYLSAYPSRFRSARWFGDQLATFLGNDETYKHQPYLSALARLEWAMTLTFDAADAPLLTMSDLLQITPEQWPRLTFKAHPSVGLLLFGGDILSVWQNLDCTTYSHVNKQTLLLWRQAQHNRYCALSSQEGIALQALIDGQTFAELCDLLLDWHDEQQAALHAASYLQSWIETGLFTHDDCSLANDLIPVLAPQRLHF